MRGEKPTLVRIAEPVRRLTDVGSLMVANCMAAPMIRAREKMTRKYHPADLPKPCLNMRKIAMHNNGT